MKSLREVLLLPFINWLYVAGNTILTYRDGTVQTWTLQGRLKTKHYCVDSLPDVKLLNESIFSARDASKLGIYCTATGSLLYELPSAYTIVGHDKFRVAYKQSISYKINERYLTMNKLNADFSIGSELAKVSSGQNPIICGQRIIVGRPSTPDCNRWRVISFYDGKEEIILDNEVYVVLIELSEDEFIMDNGHAWWLAACRDSVEQTKLSRPVNYRTVFKAGNRIVSVFVQQWTHITHQLFKLSYNTKDADTLSKLSHEQMVNYCADQFGWY